MDRISENTNKRLCFCKGDNSERIPNFDMPVIMKQQQQEPIYRAANLFRIKDETFPNHWWYFCGDSGPLRSQCPNKVHSCTDYVDHVE